MGLVYNHGMGRKAQGEKPASIQHWYGGGDVPMMVIRRFARQVVERFHPDQVSLFGSQAYGPRHAGSDADILVVMPAHDEINQAVRIRQKTDHPFPLDLIVRTPYNLEWRFAEGDSFLREIVSRGKVLYEKAHGRLGPQGREGPRHRPAPGPRPAVTS
jgi:predicted nucleotidyltransferase